MNENMNNKIVKAITAVVFLGFSVVLVLMMVKDWQAGLETGGQKTFFALYVALLIYALIRVVSLVRGLFK